MLWLCCTRKHKELVSADNPMDAQTFMRNAHPEDTDNVNTYRATDDDIRIFQRAAITSLTPRKKTGLAQLDWVNAGSSSSKT